MKTLSIGQTTKGPRVWLQNTSGTYGAQWHEGARYNVTLDTEGHTVTLQLSPEGKRKVSAGKGGIIDLCGKKFAMVFPEGDSVDILHEGDTIIVMGE
jgi:hypothetical protein